MRAERPTGYRGSLPTRNDSIARPWVITVIVIFVLMFVLAFFGLPGKLFPKPTASPRACIDLQASASPAGSEVVSPTPTE
jgi:hypothetical protein